MQRSVGIITVHYVDNIGGVLLAYALQESIERLGYRAEVVDYDPTPIPATQEFVTRSLLRRLRKIPQHFRHPRRSIQVLRGGQVTLLPARHPHGSAGTRGDAFLAFRRRYLRMSAQKYRTYASLEENPPQCDAYVCGSDQIWNPFMLRVGQEPANDPAYFLRFAPERRRVSYAPSIAVPSFPRELEGELRTFVNEIPALSVREIDGARLLEDVTGRAAQVVLDPTLLLRADDWSELASSGGSSTAGGYIFCYFLGEGGWYREFAQRLSSRHNLRLVVVSRFWKEGFDETETENRSDCGPAEFLSLLANAAVVVTDSYHGTLFSINFNRPFYVAERPGSSGGKSMSSRIHSILEILGFSDRLISEGQDPAVCGISMRFDSSNRLLEGMRQDAIHFLDSALRSATGG